MLLLFGAAAWNVIGIVDDGVERNRKFFRQIEQLRGELKQERLRKHD